MYKYLLFDLDDTLLDFKKAQDSAMTENLQNYQIKATPEILKKYAEINAFCWHQFEKGKFSRPEIFVNRVKMLGDFLGTEFEYQSFTSRYLECLSRQGQIIPYSVELLIRLGKKGYKIAAASNGTVAAQTGRLVVSGLAGFFKDGIFLSEKVGIQKPNLEFFEYVLNKLGVKNKKEVLMIGDSISSDIAGANAVGIDSCLVDFDKNYTSETVDATYIINSLEEIITVCKL